MGDTLSEYLYTVVNTIIFLAALGFFIMYLNTLSTFNRQEIKSQRNKASINMDTTYGYDEPLISMLGSNVFIDIYSGKAEVPILLDGVAISPLYLKNLRENDKNMILDLKSRIRLEDEYLIEYQYSSENKVERVNYRHR